MASLARTASLAALLALAAILTVEVVVPAAVTGGPPISGTLDRATIAAYYGHPGFEWALGLALFAIAIPAIVAFAVLIRELAAGAREARVWASLGAAFVIVAAPVYIVKGAIAAALVGVVSGGLDPVPLFRVYDLVYNGAIYPFEAVYVLALGMALVIIGAAGSRLRWLTGVTSAMLLLNGFVLYLGLPSAVALPGNLAFSIWLASASAALWRFGPVTTAEQVAIPA